MAQFVFPGSVLGGPTMLAALMCILLVATPWARLAVAADTASSFASAQRSDKASRHSVKGAVAGSHRRLLERIGRSLSTTCYTCTSAGSTGSTGTYSGSTTTTSTTTVSKQYIKDAAAASAQWLYAIRNPTTYSDAGWPMTVRGAAYLTAKARSVITRTTTGPTTLVTQYLDNDSMIRSLCDANPTRTYCNA